MSSDKTAAKHVKDRFFFSGLPPLSLYIHLPWCEKKCPYCDFNSHHLRTALPEREYIEALIADLDQELPNIWGRKLSSIFIGGGTPSLFSPVGLERLLSSVQARLPGLPDIEITMEANPGSAEAHKFSEFRTAGINRLSIGVQSFDDDLLSSIGRVHDGACARRAIDYTRSAGFENFNIDLMHSLPGQRFDTALRDLETAVSFEPPHLSYYQLTIEPNTYFHKSPPVLPNEELSWKIQTAAAKLLEESGYRQYEVSAYAHENRACRHNLNYWRYGDYLGIGAGAHSKLTRAEGIQRTWKVKHPQEYLAKATTSERIGGQNQPTPAEVRFEFMLNALRLRQPISSILFQQHTGQSISLLKPSLLQAQADGLLKFDGKSVITTALGYRFLDDLLQRFLPDVHTTQRA